MKIISQNKKALHNYEILEKFEAGIVLNGQEVKSLKSRGVKLEGSYVTLKGKEVFWIGANISPYQPKNTTFNYQPERSRKLLLKKKEINSLFGKTKKKGLTLIPLKLYINKKGKIKMEFGLVRVLKKFNKKEKIKKREIEKEIERELKKRG